MFIGIDPDLHDLAIGYWLNGQPVRAEVLHLPRRKGRIGQLAVMDMAALISAHLPHHIPKNALGLAIEAQTLRRRGAKQHKRPEDIVVLGNVAGAALAISMSALPVSQIAFPTPEGWKGQIPKAVMQARLYDELGWGYERVGDDYARPLRSPASFSNISAGQWKHVGDALLLARWAESNIS